MTTLINKELRILREANLKIMEAFLRAVRQGMPTTGTPDQCFRESQRKSMLLQIQSHKEKIINLHTQYVKLQSSTSFNASRVMLTFVLFLSSSLKIERGVG